MKRQIPSIGLTLMLVLSGTLWFAPDVHANGWNFGMSVTTEGFNTVSIGFGFGMVIKEDGSLWSWGWNNYGQLGDGTVSEHFWNWEEGESGRLNPTKIMDDVASVIAVRTRAFAIETDGSLWTWGEDSTPYPTKILDSVISVTAYDWSFCGFAFAIRTDGSLWGWGANDFGQLGDGTTEDRLSPVKILDSVASISVSGNHVMAVKTDSSLWSWGRNDSGQLGHGTIDEWGVVHATPMKILDSVASAYAGWSSSRVIKQDGSLWEWGSFGYWDPVTMESRNVQILSPQKAMDDVASISENSILKTDGSLWSRGSVDNEPVWVMDGVESVTSGGSYNLTIKTDGSLWSWGSNLGGRLGDGTASWYELEDGSIAYYYSDGPIPEIFIDNDRQTPAKILDSVLSVSTFGYYDSSTFVLRTDGSLWAWGDNSNGQLGDGTTERRLSPVKVMDGIAMPGSIEIHYPEVIPEPEMYSEPTAELEIAEPEISPEPTAEPELLPELSEYLNSEDNPVAQESNNPTLYWVLTIGVILVCSCVLIVLLVIKKRR